MIIKTIFPPFPMKEKPSQSSNLAFFDALDEFPPSDHEDDHQSSIEQSSSSSIASATVDDNQLSESRDSSSMEQSSSSSSIVSATVDDNQVSESRDSSSTLRHRSNDVSSPSSSSSNSSVITNPGSIFQGISHKQKRSKILNALKESELNSDSNLNVDNDSSSFLVFLAGLVIKAIGYQFSMLISFVSFPIWFTYCLFLFMIDPIKTMKRGKDGVYDKVYRVWNVCSERFAPFLLEKLKGQKSVGKLALKFGWGFVCSMYICVLMVGLLVIGFMIGGVTMRYLVEEPIQMMESLNFDYTRDSPVALVPIMSCPSSYSGVKYHDFVKSSGSRVLPPKQNLQLTISLLVPESNYNRNLGVFQVRVDFLSENGEVTATSRLPCMLRFRSHLIRYLETFLKSIPLLAGYASESQNLHIKMRGFTEEAYKPTSCLRVVLEQRAEYRSGAGIPEIYTASILLESELPLLKRIIWFWRKTIFVWISLVSFTMELMMVLICCRPFSALGTRPGGSSTASSGIRNNVAPVVRS